ncbi:MAG: RNA polymerase sigma factor, partial [Deltaproteobacteria bacterium]|nr:RNA polymerase sigma factor [Deltaproteobacteria bacterium]
LATITVRIAGRQLRRRRLRRWVGLDGGIDEEMAASPEASPEQRAQIAELYAGLDRLPVALRLAWTLRKVQGATNPEVALHCDCSLATAKRRIVEAERRLRKMGVIDA